MQDAKRHSDTHSLRKEDTKPIECNHLHPAFQALLPNEDDLTYVIPEFVLPTEDFHGAMHSRLRYE